MKHFVLSLAFFAAIAFARPASADDPAAAPTPATAVSDAATEAPAKSDSESSDDEAAVRKGVAAYISAFNKGDADAVAALWAEDGEWISPGGERITGREAIRGEMQSFFDEGGSQIEVSDVRIRFLAPTVAVEEGSARVTRRGELPADSTYIAIHVKTADGWRLNSVRETEVPAPPTNFEELKDLDWMVGTWVDQDENSTIRTECKWTKNRNFLTRSFTVEVEGKLDLEGTQVIGWDAAKQQVRSWVFDTDGGFGEAVWSRDGDRWIVRNSQTLRDGRRASSINVITYIDDDTCTWASTGREIDGELQPDVDAVTVVRQTTTDDPADTAKATEPARTPASGEDAAIEQ